MYVVMIRHCFTLELRYRDSLHNLDWEFIATSRQHTSTDKNWQMFIVDSAAKDVLEKIRKTNISNLESRMAELERSGLPVLNQRMSNLEAQFREKIKKPL